jgi:hypothetical protein
LGAGSFGQVYKGESVTAASLLVMDFRARADEMVTGRRRLETGTYLGLDIAIKEILPRKDYDA